MPSMQFSLLTGARYNLLKLINGTQTVGVTITSPGVVYQGQTPNVDRLVLQGDPANGANQIAYGDGGIPTNGTGGSVLLAGDKDVFQAPPPTSLAAKFVSVSVNGTKLNVEWE